MESPVAGGGAAEGSLVRLLAIVARPVLSVAAQSGVALLLYTKGRSQPFRRAAGWWMVYGTAVDVGCWPRPRAARECRCEPRREPGPGPGGA
jgi:hypothetical protein